MRLWIRVIVTSEITWATADLNHERWQMQLTISAVGRGYHQPAANQSFQLFNNTF